MSSAFPALDIRSPQIESPLTTLGALANIRAAQTENLLRQQQMRESQARIQDVQAQAQQRQRALQGQQKLNSVIADPQNHEAFARGDYSAILGAGVDPTVLEPVIKGLDSMRTASMAHDQEQAKLYADSVKELGTALATIDPTDPGAADQANQLVKNFSAASPTHAKVAGAVPTFTAENFPAQFKDVTLKANLANAMLAQRASLKEAADKPLLIEAQTAEQKAAAEKAKSETTHQNLLNELLQHPERGLAAIDAIAPPGSAYNTALKATYQAAQTPEARQQVLDKGLEQAGELDPTKRQAKINDALTTARLMAPIEEAKAVNTQKALAAASPDAFAGIINPGARNEVQRDWSTLYGTAATALNQSQQLLDTIAAERAGNKAAASAITVDQARSLIANSRAMGPVMHQISAGSGNLIDQIEGKLKGIAGTDRLPSDVVKGIEDLSKVQRDAALRQYDSGLVTLKARGADVGKLPRPVVASSAKPPAIGDTVNIRGKQMKVTAVHPDGSFDAQ